MTFTRKLEAHRRFWNGEGPSLLLIPPSDEPLYDVEGYRERFENPGKMLESELRRALPVVDWPTDGIPTVRPNLGVVFIPAILGQGYILLEGQMPCRDQPLSRREIRSCGEIAVAGTELMQRAREFYDLLQASGREEIAAYHPDTQGVFDIAHLLYGEALFYDLRDDPAWVQELLEISLDCYIRVTCALKEVLGESTTEMIHGHGTPQGAFFPHGGTRISEDTVTLLSPAHVEEVVYPFIERSLEPFGGGFVHFCGKHRFFLDLLCRCPLVRAIDLGNSELFDPEWVFSRCAETGTVLYSRMAAVPGEFWRDYVVRIGSLVRQTGARCILRPLAFPADRDSCREMLDLWRELTG